MGPRAPVAPEGPTTERLKSDGLSEWSLMSFPVSEEFLTSPPVRTLSLTSLDLRMITLLAAILVPPSAMNTEAVAITLA